MPALAEAWELDVDRGPDWLLVKVKSHHGDRSAQVPLSEAVWQLLQRHLIHRVVLELDQVEVLDSHLIGQLVKLYKRIRSHDGVMRLCGLSTYNRQVLHVCQLDDRLLPYADREEAVMGRARTPRPK